MKKKETIADELVESAKNGTISFQQITDLMEMFICLEKKLAEKDKEIEELKQDYDLCKSFYDLKCSEFDKLCYDYNNLRHQVCEEIRNQFDNEYYWCYGDNHNNIVIDQDDFNIILDQIEKGE